MRKMLVVKLEIEQVADVRYARVYGHRMPSQKLMRTFTVDLDDPHAKARVIAAVRAFLERFM